MKSHKNTIATVHLTTLIQQQVKRLARTNMPQAEIKKRLILFANTLDKTIKQMAKEHNMIIMPSEAVIAGAEDVTPELAKRLEKSISTINNV